MTGRVFRATCRLQLQPEFTLAHVRELVPYLERLGVSHLYLSPVLQAQPGSTHGYDVADPSTLSPELGTEQEWRALSRELRGRGMGILLDIVPNHMGIGSSNPYWTDVLTHGQAAHYAHWFDIDWEPPQRALRGRVLVPVLGDELPAVIERGELSLEWSGDRVQVHYHEHALPIDPATAPRILRNALATLEEGSAAERALRRAIDPLEAMPARSPQLAPEGQVERYRLAEEGWTALAAARAGHAELRDAIERAMREFADGPEGKARMLSFLDVQAYRLSFWRRAAWEVNYRRFFEINELASLRMEDPVVFGERHRLLLEWIGDGLIDGLRIDHVDGLYDPAGYVRRLRESVNQRLPAEDAPRFAILVEKILSSGELLPDEWPVEGTTGYEFMNDLEAMLIDPEGAKRIEEGYRRILRLRTPGAGFPEVAHRGKLHILRTALRADVARLASLLAPLSRRDSATARASRAQLTEGIIQMIAALPVYRTYLTAERSSLSDQDRRCVTRALEEARRREVVPASVLELIAGAFLKHGEAEEPKAREERMRFVMRFQQTSGPATAKGVEDTALYRYVPLASLNEVGGDPSRAIDGAPARMHEANAERHRRWRSSLLAVSTHDTKRSADVRARLDVLSEIPDRWLRDVVSWRREARDLRTRHRDRLAPDAATEYLLFQNLVGIWPVGPDGEFPDEGTLSELCERIGDYALKAAREGKAQTSWSDPDGIWERALADYVAGVFGRGAGSPVLRGVHLLAGEVARSGMWNALSRQLVQLTAPGVPDIYQGDELWSFTLVDPDNRRGVDWSRRRHFLESIAPLVGDQPAGGAAGELSEREFVETVTDGRAKLYLTALALGARRRDPELFRDGVSVPLEVVGFAARHVFAFARVLGEGGAGRAAVVLAPRLPHTLTGGGAALGPEIWRDTRVLLPAEMRGELRALCGRRGAKMATGDAQALRVGDVLSSFPVALLVTAAS